MRAVQPESPRVVYVAVVGAPNVGKSTLVNRLVGEKVSIVSRKRNTTREAIMGIFTHENTQVVCLLAHLSSLIAHCVPPQILLDTPGIVPTENISRCTAPRAAHYFTHSLGLTRSTDRDVVIGAWRTLHHADVGAQYLLPRVVHLASSPTV